ncbi:hypothetical protein [Jannaschia formosa]|nr:hypothetical protein [Jannaschia formosa]
MRVDGAAEWFLEEGRARDMEQVVDMGEGSLAAGRAGGVGGEGGA